MLRTAVEIGVAQNEEPLEGSYYEFFLVDNDKEKLQYFSQLGLIIDIGGHKCVANPLAPDKCISYFKPYKRDHFPLKPPAASSDFFSRCIRCGLCYYQCHIMGYDAIRLASVKDGLHRFGTPIVDNQRTSPCTLCMECTKVCPTGALMETLEEAKARYRNELLEECKKKNLQGEECRKYVEKKLGATDQTLLARYPDLLDKTRMGIAMIDPDLCWAWNSGDCKSCAKACPFGAEVFDFVFTPWGVHTHVKVKVREDGTVETKCVGCGLCVAACPITGAAIHVLPKDEFLRRYRSFKNTGMSYPEYLKKILEIEDKDPNKAVLRAMEINTLYIQDIRGIKKEKIRT